MYYLQYCLADYSLLALIIKLLLLEVSESHYMEPFGRVPLLVVIILSLVLRTTHLVYMRIQSVAFPLNWMQGTIKKLRKGKNDNLRWKEIQVNEICVGDIIRMRYCDTSPVDLLVLDTSEQRYKENILKTNERKINGENKIKIKRAVRDLGLRSLSSVVAPKEYLIKLGKKLNGYIEYDPPSGNKTRFWGVFKLKNDPKVSELTEDNLLLAGSKLYSKEVIGMVMYTGDNCMIFQRNRFKKHELAQRRIKQAKIFVIINRLVLFCSAISVLLSIIFMLTMITDRDSLKMIRSIESVLIGFNNFKKFIAMLSFCLNLIPWPAKLLVEIACIIYTVRIKHFTIPGREKPVKAPTNPVEKSAASPEMSLKGTRLRSGSVSRRKSQHNLMHSPNSKTSDDSNLNTPRAKFRRKTSGRGLSITEIKPVTEPTSPGIRKMISKKSSNPKGKGSEKMSENEVEYFMTNYLNIMNHYVLPDLGIVDQVFFDKTDTLTQGSMRVAELTTYMKCYSLPQKDIQQMVGDCINNPDAFGYEDDAVKIVESENYSEKSQEYLSELEGRFNPEVLNEDSSLEPIIDARLFPNYGLMVGNPENDCQTGLKTMERSVSFNEATNSHRKGDESHRHGNPTIFGGYDGSRDSPRDYYEKNSEMKQLNALERKFKQSMAFRPPAPISQFQFKTSMSRVTAGYHRDTPPNEEDSGSQSEEEFIGENRINFRIEKRLTDKNFIYDLHLKKDHLIEMLNFLLICNEGSSVGLCYPERC